MNGAVRFAAVATQTTFDGLSHVDVSAAVEAGHYGTRCRYLLGLFGLGWFRFDGVTAGGFPIALPEPNAQHDRQ